MPALIHRPPSPLAEYVDCFWLWDDYTAPYKRERALPSGTLDIVINLRDDRLRIYQGEDDTSFERFPGIMICGAHAGYFVIHTPPQASVMGIHFKPGGAYPFMDIPASHLNNRHASLDAIWGDPARLLRDRLLDASSHLERFTILEEALLRILNAPRSARSDADSRRMTAALRAFDDPTLTRVSQVEELSGLSTKRLIRAFHERVGLGPKAYWRVRRFQASLSMIERSRPARGADIAAELGYFDQAHFNREFRAFCGQSPREYLAQDIQRKNHVPLRG